MSRKSSVVRRVSAGGVVYRANNEQVDLVVCARSSPSLIVLPKGTPEPGESREQTALREVREETGLEVRLRDYIGSIDYWFRLQSEGLRCHKTVYFYLMTAAGGDVSRHDREFDDVRWLDASEVLRTLTYANEAGIVQKGLEMARQEAGAG